MENNNTHYFLKGKKVKLRAIENEDIPFIARWLNDEEITYFMIYGQRPTNQEQVMEWIQKQHLDPPENIVFMIVDVETQNQIGFIGLYNIDPTAHKAEFRILIGNKNFWGEGYGTEATELITFYGFDRLNLNRIYSGFSSENKAAGGAYKNAGYSCEGTFKDDIYRNSRYYDGIKIAILRKDYYEKFYNSHLEKFGRKSGKEQNEE